MRELEIALRRLPAGWTTHWFESTSSTQDQARAAAREGAPDRSVFVADYQRQGRGRAGRTWVAAPGSALLVSVLLRETTETFSAWRPTALASVAMAEAITRLRPTLEPRIKWPNDLMLGHQKLAGILAEAMSAGREHVVVVGIGVNVNTSRDDLTALGAPATSLRLESGRVTDRGELVHQFLRCFDSWRDNPVEDLRRAWEARLWGRGQPLQLVEGSGRVEVVVLGAEPDGALRVRLPDGTERTTLTGELLYSAGGMRR